jgi:hypothetical protein
MFEQTAVANLGSFEVETHSGSNIWSIDAQPGNNSKISRFATGGGGL